MKARISRRALLGAVPIALAQTVSAPKKPKGLPNVGEFVRLIDPTTESSVVRLTSTGSGAYLPRSTNRFISSRDRFLIFSSDRSELMTPYRLDLRTGAIQQLAETQRLNAQSITLDSSEHSVLFLDAGQLRQAILGSGRSKIVAENVREFVCDQGGNQVLVLRGDSVQDLSGKQVASGVDHLLLALPNTLACVFSRTLDGGKIELILGSSDRPSGKRLASGRLSNPCWSGNANSILFLRETSSNGARSAQIMELNLDSLREAPVSAAGQFAAFAPNRNGSVFASALQSHAQPNVVLVLRESKREITLCEHHASQADRVNPVFSPDSRRVYFESDHEGRNAIYSVDVESLVEPTS